MAQLKPTLTLVSTDATSDSLNFTITDVLTVGAPNASLARLPIVHTSTTPILADAGSDGTVYMFLHNTSTANFIKVQTAAEEQFAILNAQEFAFIPVDKNKGITVIADTAECVLEYAYWTKS